MNTTQISKYLSYLLRHNPAEIGLELDEYGWADISQLIALSDPKLSLSIEVIEKVVRESDKQRFRLDETGTRIKANQGHSFKVANDFDVKEPPDRLYHGTAERNVASIITNGLLKQKRHHVHLSQDIDTATAVGKRYGKPVLFQIDSRKMHADGYVFYISQNNVWLTEHVPSAYLRLIDE